ncbi:cyclic nucleotide-binding domain-containing protein [Rhizobium leguminosarum]|jgi:CRP-like cAMP-binding protein|uniref:cAMP-dependent kinase n=3 Tax=Rhizobium TaxID=379 RepID=A0A1B8R488_RHILT|nr:MULTISPECIES: cyclic nucleotide-binding domain-containing protein [Rhizobium]AOO93676.1 cAMP-dependent kinase [Rhizobium leguminosarum bv. trifolii]MBA8833036.1 CRP-like cAMP-binding protein [Rhizobium leguminosarum]MBY5464521.1 cyclic nucleotide-binding domain-containing protein [Rhizobium leguminosarum]MBY5913858.1 cyclic nucleotide-binding domain-containing protein [Rhizobium leguminosarum]MDH6272195.1 CRP-like cAMP-binding protein [Rhizobium leguminosarum]
MALTDDIHMLAQLPLFKDMNEDQLRLIAFGADRRMIAAGQMLFRQGSPAESAYVILSGSLELSATSSDGMQRTGGIAGPGTLVSELALVTLVERKFTAVAREDTSIIRITRALFHRLIEEYPDAARLIENRIRDNLAELAAKAASQFYRFS